MSLSRSDAAERPSLTIDVVSDVVCPWCFIGKRKLEQALMRRPDVDVALRWRPFQLDPSIPAGGVPRTAYLEGKFGATGRIDEIHERLQSAGAAVGIDFAFEAITQAPNTLDAHRLIRWAEAGDRQNAVVEALFAGYFQDGLDVGDRKTLADLAGRHGLDAVQVARQLEDASDADTVRQEIARAVSIGVTGVPFFIFASAFAVSGAQSGEVLAKAIDKALAGGEPVLSA